MPKKNSLEQAIEKVIDDFAQQVISVIKSSPLDELMAMALAGGHGTGRKPKATAKSGRKPKATAKSGRKPKTEKAVVEKKARKTRVVKNFPKCAFEGCEKNRFPRGKGFCGEHFKMFQANEIGDAASFKK